jgi:hypothetical protein
MPHITPSQVVEVIEKLFPEVYKDVEGWPFQLIQGSSAECSALLNLVEQLPPQLLVMDNAHYTEFICSIAAIRDAIEVWRRWDSESTSSWCLSAVHGLRELNPVTLIRCALATCPDEVPSATTTELTFIADAKLRDSLRLDISVANSGLINGEWKAATVLAESVVEALLLWALVQPGQVTISAAAAKLGLKVSPNLEDWVLHQYIEVAAELKLITAETATQCRLAKDFRNLIHPGRAQRLAQVCNRGTALSAMAAVEHVVNDLTPREIGDYP